MRVGVLGSRQHPKASLTSKPLRIATGHWESVALPIGPDEARPGAPSDHASQPAQFPHYQDSGSTSYWHLVSMIVHVLLVL